MFSSWAALRKHLTGPAHARLTVVCPWCKKRERTFTRVADMKFHALNTHSHEGLEDSHFGRGVGFYYAKFPADYLRIVEEVAEYGDANASKARNLMRSWAETMEGKEALLERLNRGWKADRSLSRGSKTGKKGEQKQNDETEKTEKVEKSKSEGIRPKEKRGDGEQKAEEVERSRSKSRKSRSKSREQRNEEQERVEKSDKRRVVERKDIDEGGDRRRGVEVQRVPKEKEDQAGDNRKRALSVESMESVEERKKKRTDESDDGLKTYEDDIELGFSDSDSEDSQTDEDEEEEKSKSSDVTVGSGARLTDIRMRATRLLMQGVMPMCPPAQRDWAKVESIDIETSFGKLTWPPKGWRSFSADQKLLAQEHAAMCLEQSTTKGFPQDLSRRTLLDKYNFLTLEGSSRPKMEEGRQNRSDIKARYYQYQYVCDIAKGRVGDSRISKCVIVSLERADRWKDTDYFTDRLDDAEVKLRV